MLELTSSILILAQAFSPLPTSTQASTVNQIQNVAGKTDVVILEASPITLDEYVKNYFKDDPILYQIAKCESHVTQFAESGRAIRGIENNLDVGIMQINEFYHKEQAEKLGFDLETVDGNLAYAKNLYQREGSAPWVHSSKCWKKYETKAVAVK